LVTCNLIRKKILMIKALFINFLLIISLAALPQKVTVQIVKTDKKDVTEWAILNSQYQLVYSGNQIPGDSISLDLRSNQHYILNVSVRENYEPGLRLYTLKINGEPIILLRSDIGTGDHFYPFFTGDKSDQTKITGGTTASIADFPWQVYLIAGNFLCGGSIISDTWVVTAAHCALNTNGTPIPASSMTIKVGATSPQLSTSGKTYSVTNVIVNPNYNSATHENDIALLKIAGPINYTNAQPIKLVSSYDVSQGATDPGVLSWVTGYGLISTTPQILPTSLQKVQLPIISDAQAATVWGFIPLTDIMAGYLNGNKDACSGDSGGPLVVPVFNEFKLAGIVSWGSGACDTYGAYSSIPALESWIRTNSGIPPDFTPPSPVGDTIFCQGTDSTHYSIPAQAGATNYEWQMSPSIAGVMSGNSNTGTAIWNKNYTGQVTIWLRVTINNVVSEWSRLNTRSALRTSIFSQSHDTTMCAGNPVSLFANAAGDHLTYNWSVNGNSVTAVFPGLLEYSTASASNSGIYLCKIAGTCGTLVTSPINLTVHPVTKITDFSPVTEAAFGSDITLGVSAVGFALTYQWEKDNVLISSSNSPQLTLHNINALDIGLYRNLVKGACGSDATDSVYLYVRKADAKNDPEIFLWPSIANDKTTIALSTSDVYTIRIFSSGGMLVKELTGCRYQTTVDVSYLSRGSYIVNISTSSFRRSVKMIKR
jgi:hypothetical protein